MSGPRRPDGSRARSPRCVLAATVTVFFLGIVPAGAVTGPHRVLDGPEDQRLPSVNAAYLIWTQNSQASPNRDHAYGRPLGSADRFRLNPRGTQGYAGGIDPGQAKAIYQQVRGDESDLIRIDLDTRVRRRLGAAVNTDRWERDPRISDAFIFFARDAGGVTSLFLFDRSAKDLEKIAGYDATRFFVTPGSVGDRYATWSLCRPFTCAAWVRDTTTDTSWRIPAPSGRAQYAATVDEAGSMLYFVRSGRGCGATVGIWRRPVDLSSGAQQIASLPAGIDVGWTLSLDDDVAHSRLDLWFSRIRCAAPRQGDLYELRAVDVGP